MSKNYIVQFGNGNPTLMAGLSPTFVMFKTVPGGSNVTAPGITQIPTSTGLYYFTFGPTNSIAFLIDGATTGLTNTDRYIAGNLDPNDTINEEVDAWGNTLLTGQSNLSVNVSTGNSAMTVGITGLGNTLLAGISNLTVGISSIASGITAISPGISGLAGLIGTTASSYGSTSIDPSTVFGYLKRLQEWNEGNSTFDKSTSLWDVFSRGSSTLLAEKTLVDS